MLFCLFDLINNLSVIKGWVYLGYTSARLGLMPLAQGHNAVGERSGSVVECLTRDRRASGLSLTGVTAL